MGLPRAVAGGIAATAIALAVVWLGAHLPPHHKAARQVTYVHMVQPPQQTPLPKPPPQVKPPPPPLPPPPPQVKPSPPPPLLKPPPMTLPKPSPPPPPPPKPQPRPRPKPPPPKPHHVKPHPKPPPPRPKPRPQPKAKPQPQPKPSFDFQAYASRLRAAIQRHVEVSRAIRTLGLSGTAIVEFKLNPAGHLDWVKIYKSSGNRLIDRAAERAVRRTSAHSFPGNQSKIFAVPIEIRVGQ